MPSRLHREIEAFDATAPIERAWTPPSSWYTWPGFHALEAAAVFQRSWQLVARAEAVAAPGSYVAGCHAGMPWLVARGGDGVLRAFHNACRHKGAPVADGGGAADGFTCPYHGWRYDLAGRLLKAPRVGGIEGFDRARMGLSPMAVEIWGPLVFVHADPAAPPLGPTLSGLEARLDLRPWGDLRFHARRVYEVRCNWKVFCDNYLDGGYHIAHMHPSLARQLDLASYRTELADRWSVQTSAAGAEAQGARIGAGALYAWIYPNLMLNRYGPVLDVNLVVPVAADRCEIVFDFWVEPGLPDAERYMGDSAAQSHVTQLEDIAISERVQVGLASPGFDRGPYAPRVEQGIHHFHRVLAADLAAEVARRSDDWGSVPGEEVDQARR